jgi:hypothetical protein
MLISGRMKLLDVVPARDGVHKYKAVFLQDSGRKRTTAFGAVGYKDFIQYSKEDKDIAAEHKNLYLTRHRKTEHWDQPLTAGALSRWVLWNRPSLQESVEAFRKKFQL